MRRDTTDRLLRALAGAPVVPVAEGLSFVAPALLPGPGGAARPPAPALARTCADLRLDFAFVPSWEPWALAAVAELRAVGVAALWVVPGVLTPALDRLGVLEGLRLIETDVPRLAAILDETSAEAAEAVDDGVAAGAHAVVVADDLAGADGPIASPEFLAAEVFPRLSWIARRSADAELPALLHCDGAAGALFEAVSAAGFAAVHGDCGGPERTAAALAAARRAGLVLVGGLSAADLTDLARAAAAGAAAADLAAPGGMLISDDGGVATAAECAALFAALGAARR